MEGSKTTLTEDDIRKLVKSPVDTRLDVTKKIGKYYTAGGFGEEQRKIAEKIFRALLKDTEVEVRRTLSEAVKLSKDIPADVVKELARDINEVSIPVLEFSEVLSDADLIEIIESTEDISKQQSVTRRKSVSKDVSDALIQTGSEKVVDSLLHNRAAELSDGGYKKIVDEFANKESVLEAMVERGKLPVHVMETLAATVSREIYNRLTEKHKLAMNQLGKVVGKSQEAATMKVMGMQSTEQEYYQFTQLMNSLHISEELMPISALCVGNLNLFEVCIARATKVPVLNVRTLMQDESNKGFRVLYERAKLPEKLFDATSVLVSVLRELKDELNGHGIKLSNKLASLIVGKLMMAAEERGEIENIDYIVTLIRHNVKISEQEE